MRVPMTGWAYDLVHLLPWSPNSPKAQKHPTMKCVFFWRLLLQEYGLRVLSSDCAMWASILPSNKPDSMDRIVGLVKFKTKCSALYAWTQCSGRKFFVEEK